MSNSINVNTDREEAPPSPLSYVVEGATLVCTLGTAPSKLQIPPSRRVFINGKKQANITDDVADVNLLPFGTCNRPIPPQPCIRATAGNRWVAGKHDMHVEDENAMLNTDFLVCNCGGIITVVDDRQ